MIDVKKLIRDELEATKLDILVFGPAVDPPSSDPFILSLQGKRKEIKQKLLDDGHHAYFGEDVVDPTLPAHVADPLLQEIVAMRAADLIFVLLGSPGANAEAVRIAAEPDLCKKSSFYCFEDHKDGLLGKQIRFVSDNLGATFSLVTLASVQACSLTGAVLSRVRSVQAGKAFLF